MKKRNLIYILLLVMVLVFTSCSASQETTEAETTEMTTIAEQEDVDEALPVFSAEELAKYTGKDGNRAYVAYEGKVYDVTDIPAWKNGIHQNQFEAGKDYTDVLNNQAPHQPTNLTDNAPIVGIYE